MHLFNADGSRAEMSGNGARCLVQALAVARNDASLHVVIDTDGGARSAVVDAPMGLGDAWVTVDMGPAHPGPDVPPGVHDRVDGRIETVDLGNPHLVVDGPDPDLVDLADEGAWIEKQFPEGINVEYAAVADANVLALTVWERGAGITQACGTGACAAAYAFNLWGLVGSDVEVRMPGGAAFVTLGDTITLAGPTSLIATIEVDSG
jgi:diaminopimelate epimerase